MGWPLKIPGDGLELVDRCTSCLRRRTDCRVEAMIEVIVDEGLLGLVHGALDRVKLLRQIKARATSLDHLDHLQQVAARALQAFDDGRVRFMGMMMFVHAYILSPQMGCIN